MDAKLTRHREAFPKFDLIEAKAAMERMRAAVCVFDLGRRTIGQTFIAEIQDDSVILNYLFADKQFISEENRSVIKTREIKSKIAAFRRLFVCPLCDQSKQALYYKDTWACATCLRLHYRSQLIDKEVKLWEELDELRTQLRRGRPTGMHHKTFIKLKLRLSALEYRFEGRERKEAGSSHNVIVTSRWVPGAEIDLWSANYAVRGGNFVVRETWL
jgi:hypothetical protein